MLWADLKPTHDSLKVLIGARIEEDSSVSDADPATSARPKRGLSIIIMPKSVAGSAPKSNMTISRTYSLLLHTMVPS